MKRKGKNIISDQDITMTSGKNFGKELSEVIGELQTKVSKHDSELKFFYNHGAMGASGGGGGNGSGNNTFSIYATLNEKQISGDNISLGRDGLFPLTIKINRPNGADYSVRYTYTKLNEYDNEVTVTNTVQLTANNSWEITIKDLEFKGNTTITVAATDSVYAETKQKSAPVLTRNYVFTPIIKTRDTQGKEQTLLVMTKMEKDTSNIITTQQFISSFNNGGLWLDLDYEISSEINEKLDYDWEFTFNTSRPFTKRGKWPVDPDTNRPKMNSIQSINILDFLGEQGWADLVNNKYEINNNKAGQYTVDFKIKLQLKDQNTTELNYKAVISMIPKDLFLLVNPEKGIIYNQKGAENPVLVGDGAIYSYIPGQVNFIVTPFRGTESDKECTIYYYLVPKSATTPIKVQIASTRLGEGAITLNKIATYEEGWHEVKFKLICGEEKDTYPKPSTPGIDSEGYISYWFYTKPADQDLIWEAVENERQSLGSIERNYYRHALETRNLSGYINTLSRLNLTNGIYQQTTNSDILVVGGSNNPNDIAIPDTGDSAKQARHNVIINIGLSYSEINPIPDYTTDDYIVKGLYRNGQKFVLSQNCFVEGTSTERQYFYPKSKLNSYQRGEDFHLLTIVARVAQDKKDGSTIPYNYELSLYIDGRLECTLGKYINNLLLVDELQFGKVNAKINLIEIDYVPPIEDRSDSTGKNFLNEDNFVYRYYLKYRSLLNLEVTDQDKRILGLLNNITVSNNGDVKFDSLQTVTNMAEYLDMPTLVLSIDDRSTSGTEVMTYLKDNLTERAKAGNLTTLDTSVMWHMPGQSSLSKIEFPTGSAADTSIPNLSTAKFTLKPQGTSSMLYKCKNYTLALENTDRSDEAGVFLFSPNFDINDSNTFLPEAEFTLKADVVDSGHSNNTSIGRFVNDVCRGFNTNEKSNRPANILERAGFIRNCLEGFPCVVYIDIKTKDLTTGAYTVDNIYYQGMYNFNLGRGSYYNLGYKDSKVFCDATGTNCLLKPAGGGFTFYSISKDNDQFKQGLVIAEVQDNRQYHDFSQYDSTILFQQNENDVSETPMFGDFVKVGWATESQQQSIIKNYVEKVAKGGGYLFESVLNKTLIPYQIETDDDTNTPCGYETGYSTTGEFDENGNLTIESVDDGGYPVNVVPNYKYQFNKVHDKVLHLKGVEQANQAAINAVNDWQNSEQASEIEQITDPTEREDRRTEAINEVKRNAWEAELRRQGGMLPASNDTDFWNAIGKVDDSGIIPAWVDYISTSEYYTICMAFGLVDSVEKNLNIKSWNATINNPNTGDIDYGKFYAAFYDMDTCLGLDNAGNDDVSYFSFSDYWVTNYKTAGGKKVPQPAIIYRDYAPLTSTSAKNKFYDVPSSYLFAIAKYAPLVVDSSDASASDILEYNPRKLWAKWRSIGVENPQAGDSTGCLRSADWFMDKYFSSNLGKLQAPLINMNYRNKYIYTNNQGIYDVDAIDKFHGTRLYRVKDWLEGRLHILDAYFNLSTIGSEISYYNNEGKYVSFENKFEMPITDVPGLSNNTDIVILQDIFAGNQMLQIDGQLNISVRAMSNSPLFITGAGGINKYIIGGYQDSDIYNINMVLLGSQTFSAGGSGSWTYLDSINTFRFKTLVIRSKYLEEINGTDPDYNTSISTLELPSLKNLTLSGTNYNGYVELTGNDFPNLNKVNISNNVISLNLFESNLKTVNISGKTGGSVKIDSCPMITDLGLNSTKTKLSDLIINQISYNLIKTTARDYQAGGLLLNGHSINNITITNTTTSPSGYASKICICNDPVVEKISLTGFKYIYIYNCPKLNVISISDPEGSNIDGDRAEVIYIHGNGVDVHTNGVINNDGIKEELRINSITPGVVDLSGLHSLQKLTISSCSYITQITVKAEGGIEIPSGGFSNDWSLKYLGTAGITQGPIYLTDTSYNGAAHQDLATFMNNTHFQMLNDEGGELTNLKVRSTVNNLNYLFYIHNGANAGFGYLPLQNFCRFINNGIENKLNITSIRYICFKQYYNFGYNEAQLIADLKAGSSSYIPSLGDFKNLSDVRHAFSNTNMTAWHPNLFNFGANVNRIYFQDYMLCNSSANISTTYNVLYNILKKIDYMFGAHESATSIETEPYFSFRLYDTSGNLYYNSETTYAGTVYRIIRARDFFADVNNRSGNHYKGNMIDHLDFATVPNDTSTGRKYLYSFAGLLDDMSSTLVDLHSFLRNNHKDYRETEHDDYVRLADYSTLLYNMTNVTTTFEFFNMYNPNFPVQLTKFLNWYTVCQKATNLFEWRFDSGRSNGYLTGNNSFNMSKWITDTELNTGVTTGNTRTNPFWDYLVGTTNERNYRSSLTKLDNIFRNCTLILTSTSGGNEISFVNSALEKNTRITSMVATFSNFRIIRVPNASGNYTFVSSHFSSSYPTEYMSLGSGYGSGKFFEQLPNVIYFDRCFEGTRQQYQPSINFFNKRTPSPSAMSGSYYILKRRADYDASRKYWENNVTYYVDEEYTDEEGNTQLRKKAVVTDDKSNDFIPVKVYRYSYKNTIQGLYRCFFDVDWKSGNKTERTNGARFFSLYTQEGLNTRDVLRQIYGIEGDYIWIDENIDLTGTDWSELTTKINGGYVLKWDEFDSIYATNESFKPVSDTNNGKDPNKVRNYFFWIKQNPDSAHGNVSRNQFLPYSRLLGPGQNSELTELAEEIVGGYNYKLSIDNINVYNYPIDFDYARPTDSTLQNFSYAKDRLIFAPDIFYGCASNCNIQEVFYTTKTNKLQGIIPKKLFKSVRNQAFYNIFKDSNVIPRYVGDKTVKRTVTYTDGTTGEVNDTQHCYVYVPNDFTNCTDLSNSFNWHMIIPEPAVINNQLASDYSVYSIFTSSSFLNTAAANITSMSYAFPQNMPLGETGLNRIFNGTWSTTPVNHQVYYRLMVDSNFKDIGIDPIRFAKLRWDNIISSPLAYWLNGQWMVGSYNLDEVLKFSPSAPMVNCTIGYYNSGIGSVLSNQMIMPTYNKPETLYEFIYTNNERVGMRINQMFNPDKLYTKSNKVNVVDYYNA
jgi:hypothetical protein